MFPFSLKMKKENLVLASGEGGGLVSVHPKFDKDACRRAITLFVILDEHPFRVVNIMTFNQIQSFILYDQTLDTSSQFASLPDTQVLNQRALLMFRR